MPTLNEQLVASHALEDVQDAARMKPAAFGQTQIERRSDVPIARAEVNPMALLQIAMSQNADIDKLTKLMELQERWEANEARKAYNLAMAKFKENPPKIGKNKHVNVRFKDGGGMEYDHATLDNICDAIIPALSRVGISHRWGMRQEAGRITVTCTLTHETGHSETTELSGSPDDSGKKNPIQQVASTVTYLQRYTLLAATGMATGGMDTDGNTPSKGMDPEEIDRYEDLIANAPTIESLQQKYLAAAKDAKEAGDRAAAAKFNEMKNKRYRELAQ